MKENFQILKPILKGLPLIVLVVFLSILLAKKYLNYVTPLYESTAILKLADTQEGVTTSNLFKDFDLFASANKISTEIEVIKSSSLIEKTLDKINFSLEIYRKGEIKSKELFDNSPFLVEGTFGSNAYYDEKFSIEITSHSSYELRIPGQSKPIKGKFGTMVAIPKGKLFITLNSHLLLAKPYIKLQDTYEFIFLSREKLLEEVKKNLDVVSVEKEVPVVRINYKSSVPQKAMLFVNTLAETYVQDYIENKYKAAETTVEFLNSEIKLADEQLANSEYKIENFREQQNIINIPQETETDLRKIAQLKIQQSNIRMNLDAVKSLNKYIEKGKTNYKDLAANFEAFTDLLSTEMVKNMKQLEAEKKELLLTYTPEHEKVKVIDSKLKDLVDYQIESVKNTEKNLQIKYNDISHDISSAQQAFVGLPEKERKLAILNREFDLYEQNYIFLNQKRIDAEIAKAAKISFHKIITKGEFPHKPISPVRSIIVIGSAILGLFLSIILLYLYHFATAKINDAPTVEKYTMIPICFSTPYSEHENEKKEIFHKNCLDLELKGILTKNAIISISSYRSSNEYSFITKNVFNTLKNQAYKVLMIDTVGNMTEFATGDILDLSCENFLTKTAAEIKRLIQEKSSEYDFCIINSQPITKGALAVVFMQIATQNLVVLDVNKTTKKELLKIALFKEEYGVKNLWFVLNKINHTPSYLFHWWKKNFRLKKK